eukprot:CAMPEP_0115847920 /NCGR_PEP_ID=MMETSP0287-20121206/10641_1 /TAXON_ID=412157 /ORGANISM="Chrysochromulina rotalis, Strain UIO044" /LENGTH=898 /DNA_ID=CAMNT_0003301789 /DNA_START=6 /DNA_END=2702 /DNA_ORIENTATION=+
MKLWLLAVSGTAAVQNLNGRYSVASVDQVGVPFNDDFASKGHEFFDVWAPEIATTYGQSFWTDQHDQPLPKHILERFKGKVIAITGYEQDQVLVSPVGQPGVNPDLDVSVPINWAYNHHYMMWMTGKHSQLRQAKAGAGADDVSAHGAPIKWMAVEKPSAHLRANPDIPTSHFFSEGNGGESRKSFHGYPAGFAQLIDSPEVWHVTPMQIDTRRRDCGVTREDLNKCVEFEPWLEPKQARYGRPAANTNYSGVLECPCTDRYGGDPIFYPHSASKVQVETYLALPSGSCGAADPRITSASQCYEAASTLGLSHTRFVNVSLDERRGIPGCSVVPYDNGTISVVYNEAADATGECAAGEGAAAVRSGAATSLVNITLGLHLDPNPRGGLATISLRGPADVWFGVGFDAQNMADAPYTIYVNASGAFEQKIGTCGSEAEHCAGDPLAPSLTLLSNTVIDGWREVVLTRAFAGASEMSYSFDIAKPSPLKFITAFGTSPVFEYHGPGNHHAATVTLLAPSGLPTCLCSDGASGKLCDTATGACDTWVKDCWPPWDGAALHEGADLLAQQNPTCSSGSYAGGLRCCSHGRVLLDHDQDPGPTLLRYHMKFRFWFQEYTPGVEKPGAFEHMPGKLPDGYDVREPALVSTDEALRICADTDGCRGISFASDSPKAATGSPVKTYFTGLRVAGGEPGWQSWVLQTTPPSHYDLPRYYYTTEANAGEYDVPPAFRRAGDPPIPGYAHLPVSTSADDLHLTPGTTCKGGCPDADDCECVHTITMHWLMSNARMLYAGGHCHAPSCISIELYRNDTGVPELLCRQQTRYGAGNVTADKFDEAGYVALPPCLWGEPHESLAPPSWLPSLTPMYSIKRNRNTHAGHFGEMASWQMRGVAFPASTTATIEV